MEIYGIALAGVGGLLLVLIVLNKVLTRNKKPKKDTRSAREKNLDKIANIKGSK